jgi:hypothetical protein
MKQQKFGNDRKNTTNKKKQSNTNRIAIIVGYHIVRYFQNKGEFALPGQNLFLAIAIHS